MDKMNKSIPKAAIRGTASGVLFMAFFGTAWAGIGIGGLQGWGTPWLPIIAVCLGLVLLAGGIHLIWASRNAPILTSETDTHRSKRIGIGFGITFAAEAILIAAAGAIFGATNHFEYFFPVMALIVGIHFFPLAHLFQVHGYYVTGALLCILSFVTFLLPMSLSVGSYQMDVWESFIGFTSSLVLWITGIAIWIMGKNMLKK